MKGYHEWSQLNEGQSGGVEEQLDRMRSILEKQIYALEGLHPENDEVASPIRGVVTNLETLLNQLYAVKREYKFQTLYPKQ